MGNSRIIAGMATMPGRKECLAEAISSIIEQVDFIYVYVNGVNDLDNYSESFWTHPKLIMIVGKDMYGDLGDAGKFFMATEEAKQGNDGYYFSMDDDIIYPRDYCLYMISKMNKYDNKKVIGLHGKRFRVPISSFYRDRNNVEWFHNQRSLIDDKPVHMLGTGIMAYHLPLVRITISDLLKEPRNSADIHFGELCQSKGVGMICAAHSANHIMLSQKINHNLDTIFALTRNNDAEQTNLVNRRSWQYF